MLRFLGRGVLVSDVVFMNLLNVHESCDFLWVFRLKAFS